ncbi:uncharacterized protein L969DRAFT_49494 [Mixia osmundae IAM 14324]|uniref:aspartate kinase n=1 Tax=Mixia osmundae (strain CBS 9802 / IAM 14324 / JCM 22182 / KY 12970) TaxID=764103 RepID=G7E463_MIXOS|nr:uncharacterized protein L969DRAFT_49494 [Mixia osmundae IAM 14324]KEI39719.1 hypothetical protein L969DRAFT_49494 [Mixia osmundae IAM 14324]GAA97623.1 hypothetical protein E5Q_04301 [Mixia osmundae IAM 14324]
MADDDGSDASTQSPELRGNPSEGDWVVQKFGGTSIGKFVEVIAQTIVPRYLDEGHRVALVCSARSGQSKSTGTTNLLIQAAQEALRPTSVLPDELANGRQPSPAMTPSIASASRPNPLSLSTQRLQRSGSSAVLNSSGYNSPGPRGSGSLSNSLASLKTCDQASAFDGTVDKIKSDHLSAARSCISDPWILRQLEEELSGDCEALRSFLLAAQIIDEISLRSKDIIVGYGERLSCRIVAAMLEDKGFASEFVSLESVLPKPSEAQSLGQAEQQLSQAFYDDLAGRLGQRLRQCEGRIPVVTGFFGIVPGSLLLQIGRGYTDLCAALCAVGLQASELQVWKEVDGIFTADPRKVPTARLLPRITPEEAAELTYYGSEVIHPFTMEQVIRAAIPIRIKNVQNPAGAGTVIFPDSLQNGRAAKPAMTHINGSAPRLPTAVTIKDNIVVLNIHSNRRTISHGFFAGMFATLDRYGIVVDLISTSEVHVSMAMNDTIRKGLLDSLLADLKKLGEITVKHDMAILSLVGKEMQHSVGIAGKMFTTLADGSVNIEMISQGSSEINISCVIENRDAAKALNLIHLRLLSLAVPPGVPQSPISYV